jgi:hypothetical protein
MQKEFVTLDTETLLHLLITSVWTTERKDYQNEFPRNYRLVTQAQEKVRQLVIGDEPEVVWGAKNWDLLDKVNNI